MDKKLEIAVLLACFNRREKTMRCLDRLFNLSCPSAYEITAYLVDDGSTDGTGKAVSEAFPQVKVIRGTGDLFWGGGMLLAWQSAAAVKDYDFYLWVNDDTFLFDDALATLLADSATKNHEAIICGTTVSARDGSLTYGGRNIGDAAVLKPTSDLQECQLLNGNFVLVPQSVYHMVGLLDVGFRHGIGDHDYGLRAIGKGVRLYVASKVVGECETNAATPAWRRADLSIRQRWARLYSPLGNDPLAFFRYECRHFGLCQALKHFLTMNLRIFFPIKECHE
jgi:GT2 family glycosyltransferase